MPTRHEWQSRIKAVEREYTAMQAAADRLLEHASVDPTILRKDLRRGEILVAAKNLEGTYIIRLFAEFESGARECWAAAWGTDVKTFDLLQGFASRRRIPFTEVEHAHEVRRFRNSLVHERHEPIVPMSLAAARKRLCTFFSYLPADW